MLFIRVIYGLNALLGAVVGSFFETKFGTFYKDELQPNVSAAEGAGGTAAVSSAGFWYS